MTQLISFEIKKIVKSHFFLWMLAFLCLLLIGYYVFIYVNTIRPTDLVAEYDSRVHLEEEQIQNLKDLLSTSDGEENEVLESEIEFFENFLINSKATLKAYQEEDWVTILNQEIALNEPSIQQALAKREYYTSTHPTLFTMETLIEQQKWLRDRSIQPVLYVDSLAWYTIYDIDFGEPIIEEIIKKRSTKYSSTGVYFINHVSQQFFGIMGALFFLFLFSNIVTKEGLRNNGPIHLLHTQPISRSNILVSKVLANIIVSILILVAISIFSLLLGTLFDGFGEIQYPVLIYGEDYTFNFIEMSSYLLQSTILFFLILLFSYSLLFLFSIITKRTLLALGLTIAVILVGIEWSKEAFLTEYAPYIPFHYFSVQEIITNEIAVTLKNFDFSYTNGLISLSICSISIFLLTYLVSFFQNKFSH